MADQGNELSEFDEALADANRFRWLVWHPAHYTHTSQGEVDRFQVDIDIVREFGEDFDNAIRRLIDAAMAIDNASDPTP